jgi:hypothetical protein
LLEQAKKGVPVREQLRMANETIDAQSQACKKAMDEVKAMGFSLQVKNSALQAKEDGMAARFKAEMAARLKAKEDEMAARLQAREREFEARETKLKASEEEVVEAQEKVHSLLNRTKSVLNTLQPDTVGSGLPALTPIGSSSQPAPRPDVISTPYSNLSTPTLL